jgi:DedD protein
MMDRRVKERLVGATILVALIVVVVPELLSGPKPSAAPPLEQGLPSATREVQVDLATSRATREPVAPASAGEAAAGRGTDTNQGGQAPDSTPAPGSPAAPAPSDDVSAPPAAAQAPPTPSRAPPTVTTLRAQGSGAPLETAPASPTSTTGTSRPAADERLAQKRWAVQLGSFASKANAEKLVHQVQSSAGASLYVVSSGSGTAARYRVRMGPLADRGAAERAVARLKAQGHAATIVTPSS